MNQGLGRIGEEVAAKFIGLKGLQIIERNYTCPVGEIDIIAQSNGRRHFIEVKSRSSLEYGRPAMAVTLEKQAKLRRVAAYYMVANNYLGDLQFDVVEVVYNPLNHRYQVDIISNAFLGVEN